MKKIIYWASTLIVAVAVGFIGGAVDILQTENVMYAASHLGYPLYFFSLLGFFKILGGIALLLPNRFVKIKEFAYAGFTFDFIFASFSHFSLSDPMKDIVVPLVFLVLLFVSYKLKESYHY